MHRFFFRDTRRENDRVRLDAEETRHAVQVLRLKKGASIILLDGLGSVFEAEIEDTGTKQKPAVTARILSQLPDNEPRTRVTLYQGLPKQGKLETILQKCTELGVHALQPVQFERSVKEDSKNPEKTLQRLRRVASEAVKQCGRGQVPMVGQTKPLSEVMDRITGHGLLLIPWEEERETRIADVMGENPPHEIAIVIGPEGGIAPEEVERLVRAGGRTVTLGPRILRTETAGMAALVSVLTLAGDM
ncbi:16S rRNA (uracil(1498)-N(3))-methyltransferase [Eubacteriales bacterium OttesenSCG-928-A19]|nr:16S rRNA (uracil(1498)-N(3))-methyltransferase [Eubacteriales bacterium OttesenSCG-928-A19]